MAGQVLEIALVIDDRDEVLHDDDHADAWREWLRISNALNLREQVTSITAVTDVLTQAVPQAAKAATPGAGAEVPPEWQETWEQTLEGRERSFLEELAALAVDPPSEDLDAPSVGYEDGGIPLDFAWPEKRMAVCIEIGEDERHTLESAGWRLLPDDPAVVAAALRGGS
jgi:hypothetical protein